MTGSLAKKKANSTILSALKKLGVPYINMNIQQAMEIVADRHGINLGGLSRIEFAAAIAERRSRRKPEREPYISPPIVTKRKSDRERQIAGFYTCIPWKQLAYDTKVKRGRRCECCGATPADGVRIVTDHIKPLRTHWDLRLDPGNVQVLCDDCNRGKGSRSADDFRS